MDAALVWVEDKHGGNEAAGVLEEIEMRMRPAAFLDVAIVGAVVPSVFLAVPSL